MAILSERRAGEQYVNGDVTWAEHHSAAGADECGMCGLRGRRLEKMRRPVIFLVFICIAAFSQSMCVNGLIGVTMSTVEKRYGLRSAQSGWIPASYELAGIPVLVTLGLVGNKVHRPRWMGVGMVLFAIGSLMYSAPHFITFSTGLSITDDDMAAKYCQGNMTSSVPEACTSDDGFADMSQLYYLLIFVIASIIMALGSNPLFLLGTAYLDDCVSHALSALYLSIFLSCSGLGPAVGYVMASVIINHVYVDLTATGNVPTSAEDPRWVGAWWVGFIVCSILGVLIAIPIYCYPRHLAGEKAQDDDEVHLTDTPDHTHDDGTVLLDQSNGVGHSGVSANKTINTSTEEGPIKQMKHVMSNATFVFVVLAGIGDAFLIGGFTTFGPKYVETQFGLTAGMAGTLFGLATVPGAVGGTIFGGWLIKRLRLSVRGLLCFHVVGHVFCLVVGVASFMVQCDTVAIAGMNANAAYADRVSVVNLTWACNSGCECDRDGYDPVCGSDGLTYFSPCYAACSTPCLNGVCTNCSCIGQVGVAGNSSGVLGVCKLEGCGGLTLFMALFFTAMFAFMATGMFNLQIVLRCIAFEYKMMSLSVSWVIGRIFGTVPGPLLFGAAIDISCILWATKCEESSSCLRYASHQMAWLIMALYGMCKLSSVLLALAAFLHFKRKGAAYRVLLVDDDTPITDVTVASRVRPRTMSLSVAGDIEEEILLQDRTCA